MSNFHDRVFCTCTSEYRRLDWGNYRQRFERGLRWQLFHQILRHGLCRFIPLFIHWAGHFTPRKGTSLRRDCFMIGELVCASCLIRCLNSVLQWRRLFSRRKLDRLWLRLRSGLLSIRWGERRCQRSETVISLYHLLWEWCFDIGFLGGLGWEKFQGAALIIGGLGMRAVLLRFALGDAVRSTELCGR